MMISLFMTRDGRTGDHQTLEAIRLMAVARVREGEPASAVIAAYGFNADTVHGKTWGVRGQTPVVQRPGDGRPPRTWS